MARYIGPSCKKCRRYGEKLKLKGERCYTDKCSMERRTYPPGPPARRRKKMSEYGLQLRAKQKLRNIYGVLEKQFRNYFEEANNKQGLTAHNLVRFLESRLDNMIYRMGFAASRNMARQFVRYKYFTVNGKSVNIPSYRLRVNDIVKIKDKYKKNPSVKKAVELFKQRGIPEWIDFAENKMSAKLLRFPEVDELDLPVNLQLIVELYSK